MKSENLSFSLRLPVNRGNFSPETVGGGGGRNAAQQRARVRQNERARREVLARRRVGQRARGVRL